MVLFETDQLHKLLSGLFGRHEEPYVMQSDASHIIPSTRRRADRLEYFQSRYTPDDHRRARKPGCFGGVHLPRIRLTQLVQDGQALTAANAKSRHSVLALPANHLTDQLEGDDASARSNWVAQGDGSTIDVNQTRVQSQFIDASHGLRREGFVQFDDTDVIQLDAGFLEQLLHRRDRPDSHDLRRHTGGSRVYKPQQ